LKYIQKGHTKWTTFVPTWKPGVSSFPSHQSLAVVRAPKLYMSSNPVALPQTLHITLHCPNLIAVDCNPPCANGMCSNQGQCVCSAGWTGSICTI